MIGGTDISIPVADEAAALEAAVRRVRRGWPEALIQGADAERPFESFAAVPFGRERELMVFRDRESYRSWQTLGADESNQHSMLHFIAYEGALTVVVDSLEDAPTAALVTDIRAAVTSGAPFAMEAEMRRAA
jgi:hypothetical protein